jgi:hypothetical protein
LCRHCQHIIVNPAISYPEMVYDNYNPHGEARPILFDHLLPGETFNYDDYVVFCETCASTKPYCYWIRLARYNEAVYFSTDEF